MKLKSNCGLSVFELLVVLVVIGVLATIAIRTFSRSSSNTGTLSPVDAHAQLMKDQNNARHVVMVANSAVAAGAALPVSDAAALIDALQDGVTATPANMVFKVNLPDAEKAGAARFIRINQGTVEFVAGD